jgi:YcxB-like protein
MTSVAVSTTLTPRDVARVSRVLVLRNPASIWAMAAGPVCLAIGVAAGSAVYTRFGLTLVWLVVLVPGFAWLAGTYNAYRPAAREIYEPAQWTFDDGSVLIDRSGDVARAEWSEFGRWRSAAGSLLLHTTRTHYIVIPWRDVAEADRARLESLLEEHIGARKR